jgi:hypothetical protein
MEQHKTEINLREGRKIEMGENCTEGEEHCNVKMETNWRGVDE